MDKFNYYKTILVKVSFNQQLFQRELNKAFKNLLPIEVEHLKLWLQQFVKDKPELAYVVAKTN